MSARFTPLKPLQPTQAAAADPFAHAAVSASAGSGKTQVLTARVLRLLLNGARPESILCLTFTKAAAAEMANRIAARLAGWVRLKESQLGTELLNLGESNGPELRDRARKLFAAVLDCPGGLKIQTLHSFAQSLLAAFPAEAGIVPGFQPIEGRAEQELVRRTLADLVADAEAGGDLQLVRDIQCLSRRLGEQGAIEYLRSCASRHEALEAFGPREGIEPLIRRIMALPEGSVDDYLAEHCSDVGFDCDLLRAVAETNRAWSTNEGAEQLERIERWLALPPNVRAASLPDLALLVFTRSNERRKVKPGQVKLDAQYEARTDRIAERIAELLDIQNGTRLAAEIAAGLRAGQSFATAYSHAKRSAGVADFNDLIDWTRRLLGTPGMGDWVRYKLDREIDHVLIDEAQDTNAAQWEIVRHLVDEFFSGASEADERWRTLFMVGDFKQAIYGFQGTDPRQFEEARREFRTRAEELLAGEDTIDAAKRRAREFRDLSIAASFRSAQPILDTVDAVIDTLGHVALRLPEPPQRHRAHFSDRPGRVELWQPFSIEEAEEEEEEGEERWVELRDRHYATHLAERVKQLLEEAPVLASTGRPAAPGDVLILVRSRGELAALIVARLFSAGVPVAGIDRLHLHEPLAVQDLLAAIKFAVQPNDELSLAALLVSPLIGWDQEALRELAFGRRDGLWRALRDRAGESRLFAEAHDALAGLLAIADYSTPSRFLEAILSGPMQGRRKLYGRLGIAARDPIDELVNSALEFERNEIASLDRFLSWFSRGDVDVQRDPSQPANEVRVMTVHGAKGLEAPIVVLADATADPAKLGRTPLTLDLEIEGVGRAPLLRPKKEERLPPFEGMIAQEEVRDLQEHWRLLYVALTRAADRLIVSGVMPKAKKDGSDPRPPNCWHGAVEQALASIGADPGPEESHVRLTYGSARMGAPKPSKPRTSLPDAAVPDWARSPAPPEARPPRLLAPSAAVEDGASAPPPSEAQRAAARRGTLIHQLLERLGPVAHGERQSAALRWLERSAGILDAPVREEIAATVCSVIEDLRFAPLFGAGSLAEAPLAATLPDGRVIAGTVDRLLVTDNTVSVVDFKTGRVPADSDGIPAAHRAQMAAYVEALNVIFPDRDIEASLLYTAGPKLFALGG